MILLRWGAFRLRTPGLRESGCDVLDDVAAELDVFAQEVLRMWDEHSSPNIGDADEYMSCYPHVWVVLRGHARDAARPETAAALEMQVKGSKKTSQTRARHKRGQHGAAIHGGSPQQPTCDPA